MKKILLGTTGLVGAALLASAASAETPKVTLGGFSDFQAGWSDGAIGVSDNDLSFRNDNEITVRVDGKTDAGLGYGAVIDLEADATDDINGEGTNASRTFTYLEGGFGRAEMGSNKSAASTMRIDASTLAVATGGINGDWVQFVNPTFGGAATGGYITTSKLQAEHGDVNFSGDETYYNATKLTYYTPRWAGFQAGVSYTPDLDGKGQRTGLGALATDNTYGDVWEAGLGYETQLNWQGGTKLALSGTYMRADNEGGLATGAADDLEGWNAGALVGVWGFNFAGSYGQWMDGSISSVAGAADAEGDYWTAGVGYDLGAFGLSATYIDSTLEVAAGDNDFNNLVLGADYKLAPGLTPYAEVSLYEFDASAGSLDDSGTTVIVGTQLAF